MSEVWEDLKLLLAWRELKRYICWPEIFYTWGWKR